MADYDIKKLFDAYNRAKGGRDQFVPWSLFREEYGEGAKRDFLEALNNGDVEVYEKKDGIRLDGSWPRYNVGRLWLQFNF